MTLIPPSKATLLLADGTVFYGKPAGKIGTTTGEICFNTGMTGYQEVFTDPSYYGQILVMTADHIGNYGAKDEENESESVMIAGLVCKNFSNQMYSRKMASESLQTFLEDEGTVSICDLDTRAIVRHIRNKGAMNAIISSEIDDIDELKARLAKAPSMEGLELSSRVTTTKVYEKGDPASDIKIAVLDLGVKNHILECLVQRGAYLRVYPAKTSYKEMLKFNPDGFFISNGPGDPSAMPYAIETAKEILAADHPLFGICLGHQIISLACGASTFKMFNGHRGLNHPVKNLLTSRSEITSQNHGFAVSMEAVEQSDVLELTHIHLNDQTVAGISVKDKKAFSVQHHPEASPGPHDSRYLFDQFIEMIQSAK